MRQELLEQPDTLANVCGLIGYHYRLPHGIVAADEADLISRLNAVLTRTISTKYDTVSTARFWLESRACIPCNSEIARE